MENLQNIKSKLLAEQVEEQLMNYILTKPIPVGEKLPNEFKLGEIFGVGRSTVREAVKSLVSKEILEIRRGAGTFVVRVTTPEEDPLGLGKIEDKFSLAMDLVDVRLILEPEIAQRAAICAEKEDIIELRRLCDRVEEKMNEGESYIEDDIAFHTCIARCTKNQVMEQLIPIIDTAVMMFVNVTHKKLMKETVMTHRQVLEAIEAGDSIGAKTAMTMHMAYNREMIQKLKAEKENRESGKKSKTEK
ncbi:MAG: FadR family transcriptional regulator [Clostridiales bacterium]|nr:FadR family transcriptional regulator [Clostridiales bacterium]